MGADHRKPLSGEPVRGVLPAQAIAAPACVENPYWRAKGFPVFGFTPVRDGSQEP